MRLLFLGDMVGRSGRQAVYDRLPGLISDFRLDFVIVNGENAAGGFGVTEEIFQSTIDAGADVMTTGNHVWDQREALVLTQLIGLTYAQAAEIIGCPVGTVRSRVARGRDAFAAALRAGEHIASDHST